MRKRICVRQQDMTDCGAACLASVSAHFRQRISVARIRQYASTDAHGTNVAGMIEAAEKMGFDAKGAKGPYESLFRIPRPSILHVIINERLHHYVVFYGITKSRVILMDPATGRIHKKPHEAFRKEWTGVIILLAPAKGFSPVSATGTVASRFFRLLKPHRAMLVQSFFGATVYSLLGLSTSLYIRHVIDDVLVKGNLNLLALMSLVMVIILVMRTVLGIMKGLFMLGVGQHIDAVLVMGYYRHLLGLPKRFFDTMRVGEIVSRINDAVKIRTFLSNVCLDFTINGLIVTLTLLLMCVFSWKLTLIVFAGILSYGCVYLLYNKFNRRFSRRIMEDAAFLESHIIESIDHISSIRVLRAEDHAIHRTEAGFVKLLRSSMGSMKQSVYTVSMADLVSGGLVVAVIWTGASMVVTQQITSGLLISFYALLGYMTLPVNNLIRANHAIQEALIAADRLFQIMDLEQEESSEQRIELTREATGDILFSHVSFRYGTRIKVFEDLCMCIPAGKTTAIVGESGSGKTSLVSLLHKMYPLQSGTIRIGRYDIRQVSNSSLRKLIGIVPQHTGLFNGSVLENIAFGSEEADLNKIVEVCDLLQMRPFIERLPAGLHSPVGEHGVALSGGERQRIAIARALYHDPEILVLDEATSALDSDSESHVRIAIDFLRDRQKTILIIAHRLSTVMQADKICVIRNGRVVEEGQHDVLLRNRSHYFRMWQQQVPTPECLTVNQGY